MTFRIWFKDPIQLARCIQQLDVYTPYLTYNGDNEKYSIYDGRVLVNPINYERDQLDHDLKILFKEQSFAEVLIDDRWYKITKGE